MPTHPRLSTELIARWLHLFGCGALGAACLAIFGALHDQISYSVSSEYFTLFKFDQFDVPASWPPRLGVAKVGGVAGAAAGLISGLIFGLISSQHSDSRRRWRTFTAMIITATILTAVASLVAWSVSYVYVKTRADLPLAWQNIAPEDPVGVYRVAWMHDGLYWGGTAASIVVCILAARRLRSRSQISRREVWVSQFSAERLQ